MNIAENKKILTDAITAIKDLFEDNDGNGEAVRKQIQADIQALQLSKKCEEILLLIAGYLERRN